MSRSLLLLLALASPAFAQQDWPHVRGPNYDGISAETGLVETWPADGPPLLWSRELGQGYSGFSVVGGRVYTQYQTKLAQFVIAVDAETGEEIWRQRVGLPWQPAGAYPGPYATPTVRDGRVFYTTPMGEAGCLDAASGREVWSFDLRKTFGMRGVDFGYAATPLVERGRVILPVGGENASLVALDAATGSTKWAAGTDPASYCPAYPITLRGRRLIVAYLQNSVALHDAETGERVWRQRLSSHYDEHSAWPLYSEPHLLLAAPFRSGAQLLDFGRTEREIAARTVWSGKSLSNDVCSSVLFDRHVYGFDLHQLQSSPHRGSRGVFKCLEFATGQVTWETEEIGQATVLIADGKMILLNDTGTLILARVNAKRYEELARARVLEGGLCWTPPALWGRKLYVRSQAKMVCLFLGPETALDPNRPRDRINVGSDRFDWSSLLGSRAGVSARRTRDRGCGPLVLMVCGWRVPASGFAGTRGPLVPTKFKVAANHLRDCLVRIGCRRNDALQPMGRRVHSHVASLALRRVPGAAHRKRLGRRTSVEPAKAFPHRPRFVGIPRVGLRLLPALRGNRLRDDLELPHGLSAGDAVCCSCRKDTSTMVGLDCGGGRLQRVLLVFRVATRLE